MRRNDRSPPPRQRHTRARAFAPMSAPRANAGARASGAVTKTPAVVLGVCAMDKKSCSSAMREILSRIEAFGEFEIVVFGDERIVNEPVETWPRCDALISFYSNGFPLQKVEQYVELVKPFVVNDAHDQWTLLDRRLVYKRLQEHNIPVPNHIVVNRNDYVKKGGLRKKPKGDEVALPDQPTFEPKSFEQDEEYVEIDGKRICKPFVEKPANAEDHNIFIYYPHSVGGGYKRLFRKIGNQSSQYYPPPEPTGPDDLPYTPVRETTSFIYEDFMSTNGTDVKVYTVGPNYAHAEARKSPVVDGRVQRDESGKEVRYPILLTPEEKEIARRVVLAFGQNVCGFDLLRARGRSYVCDVNGWSFVKNSKKYYDDASVCLRAMILKAVAPNHLSTKPAQKAAASRADEPAIISTEELTEAELSELLPERSSTPAPTEPAEELRAVLGVIRHGDRTPKQKMKLRVKNRELLDLLLRCTNGRTRKQAKLKTPQLLQELLNICRDIYAMLADRASIMGTRMSEEAREELDAWKQIVSILEEGGHFSGINRKAQLKPLEWEKIEGTSEAHSEKVVEALLIIKFGGVLTYLGKYQAETLGKAFRVRMYPRGNYYGSDADGLLRLHSTYRHDLKIYSSDEGRVQITAAAFAKGLLALDTHLGQLTPILASLVTKDAKLLDFVTHDVEEDILHSKHKLYAAMTSKPDRRPSETETETGALSQTLRFASLNKFKIVTQMVIASHRISSARDSSSAVDSQRGSGVTQSTKLMGVPTQPLRKLEKLYELTKSISVQLRTMLSAQQTLYDMSPGAGITKPDTRSALAPRGSLPKGGIRQLKEMIVPAGGESFLLMYSRWKKLEQDLYHSRKERFDISKVPDVYDAAKYDAIHNEHLALEGLRELYELAKELADCIVPNEYGTTASSKLRIGGTIANSLIAKLLADLNSTREESFAVDSGGVDLGLRRMSISEKSPMLREEDMDYFPDEDAEGEENEEAEEELSTTRLNLRYATAHGVHSPFRHVRTRLYFTSESHLHSLINVLQYAHLDVQRDGERRGRSAHNTDQSESDVDAKHSLQPTAVEPKPSPSKPPGLPLGSPPQKTALSGDSSPPQKPPKLEIPNSYGRSGRKVSIDEPRPGTARPSLINENLGALFKEEKELDYLTHIVFRMFERFQVPPSDPRRFRIEILFSNGVNMHPFKKNTIEVFDKIVGGNSSDWTDRKHEDEDISDELLKEIPIQNDRIKPDHDYLTLSTMEEYLANFNRRGSRAESSEATPGKVARSSSVGSDRVKAGRNLFVASEDTG